MIKLIPVGGLCNRMRSMDSAIAFCAKYKVDLEVLWMKQEEILNCRFEDLFLPIDVLKMIEREGKPLRFQRAKFRNYYLPALLNKLPRKGKTYSEKEIKTFCMKKVDFKTIYDKSKPMTMLSFSRFYPNSKPFEYFRPVAAINDLIDKETQLFDEFTIGIHIRRTDHVTSIETSPIELFEKNIEMAIAENDRANFYLASDCADTKQHLVNKYGERIKTNFRPGDRNTLEGMRQATAELYALSKTQKVMTSNRSSYSQTACLLTGIEGVNMKEV